MLKSISQSHQLAFKTAFPGLSSVDIMAHDFPIEPFLVFTEFKMNQPVFGPHPHAGVSVMTYILPQSKQGFTNRDSMGDHSYIEPGGLHITQAGSGMFHDEFPKTSGIVVNGFQIWINHKESDRWVQPQAFHLDAVHVPEMVQPGYRLRILHGQFQGLEANVKMVTPVQLYHISLNAFQTLNIPALEMAFIYGLSGKGFTNNQSVSAQTLTLFSAEGDEISIQTQEHSFECMFASAQPINESLVYGGPFVMTTQSQMLETKRRYARGEMGELSPNH